VSIKLALPKGRLLRETAALLKQAGLGLSGYTEKTRLYRLKSQIIPELSAKMFHEKDIPIQVAVGNYDLGICGLDWIEELLVKYKSSPLIKLVNLGYGTGALYMVASKYGETTLKDIQAKQGIIRIASEYPNLAESFAADFRLRWFSVFPLWGAAEVYPPENADLALIAGRMGKEVFNNNLIPVKKLFNFSAFLIANKNSWETKDMAEVLSLIRNKLTASKEYTYPANAEKYHKKGQYTYEKITEDMVRLALPDGHQQSPTIELLNKAGIQVNDYPSPNGNRRPATALDGVVIKVVRPQDMPLQVANENFDLAITGKDWLLEHLY